MDAFLTINQSFASPAHLRFPLSLSIRLPPCHTLRQHLQTQDLFDAFQVVQGRAQGRGSDPVEAVPPDRDPDQVYYDEVMDAMDTYLTPELQDSWD